MVFYCAVKECWAPAAVELRHILSLEFFEVVFVEIAVSQYIYITVVCEKVKL